MPDQGSPQTESRALGRSPCHIPVMAQVWFRSRRLLRRNESGFTLVEMMVVVLIMAILMAIAIPAYLGARHRAENRAAQENLHTALTAAMANFSDSTQFAYLNGGWTVTQIQAAEPALKFVNWGTNSTNPTTINVSAYAPTPSFVMLFAESAAGNCQAVAYTDQSNPSAPVVNSLWPHPGVYTAAQPNTPICSWAEGSGYFSQTSAWTSQGRTP